MDASKRSLMGASLLAAGQSLGALPGQKSATEAGALSFQATGLGATSRPLQEKLRDTVSVLDFIPQRMHADIKAGRNHDDLTGYFQAAANAATPVREGATTCAVYVPNGLYHVTRIGIRGLVFRGQSRSGTVLTAFGPGQASEFMLDAMLDRDGVTQNTHGGGWAESLTIDGAGSGRSALRLYGGGSYPHDLDIRNAATGLAYGLPIWCRISNVNARSCEVGFHTFHHSPGANGTSAMFEACWALDCSRYGFHITQLYYSSFINCVSQNAGTHNFYVEGDANGGTAVYSLQFIGCATEGAGTPFYFRRCRETTVINPRIIESSGDVHFLVLDDAYGSIIDFSTVQGPAAGCYHIDASRNAAYGAVLLIGGDVTFDPAFEDAFTRLGVAVNGAGWRTTSAHGGFRVRSEQVVGARDTGWSAATGNRSKGAYSAIDAGTASPRYVRDELQAALDRIAAAEARIVAYDAALRTHGLIGS